MNAVTSKASGFVPDAAAAPMARVTTMGTVLVMDTGDAIAFARHMVRRGWKMLSAPGSATEWLRLACQSAQVRLQRDGSVFVYGSTDADTIAACAWIKNEHGQDTWRVRQALPGDYDLFHETPLKFSNY